MPKMNSFLIISAAGLPIFSLSSLTVIVSPFITAFSIFTGSGLGAGATCLFFFLPPKPPSSSHAFIEGAASFNNVFLFFLRSSSRFPLAGAFLLAS